MLARLIFPLLGLSFTASAQVSWPRSPATDSIEFTGLIPWQATDTSITQRRTRVQQWYYDKLRDDKPAATTTWASKYDKAPLTRISLSGGGYFIYHKAYDYILTYEVMLSPTPEGMKYRFSNFTWGWQTGYSRSSRALESLHKLSKSDRLSLQVFRERMATALAGW
jgi:hypothetical protein